VDIYSALKVIADGSAQLITWALALGAASVAAIVSTSYLQPKKRWRLPYLLFAPAWIFVGVSVYFGNQVSRRYMAATLVPKETLARISEAINTDFARQQQMLSIALLFFAAWLTFFLYWWIFAKGDPGDVKPDDKSG
jgi:hypothetical protein